jgi:hypothetical protein
MYYPYHFTDREMRINYERMCLQKEMYGPWPQPEPEAVEDAEQSLAEDILEAQRNISDLWRKSGDNTLRIGYWLNALHGWMAAEKFSAYTREDLADLGISRSSAYRWMVLDKNLQRIFPNSFLCNALVRLGDGRGIFAAFRVPDKVAPAPAANDLAGAARESKRTGDPSQTPLTPAALEALAGLPAPPREEEGDTKANDWAKSFIKTMNRIRARQRAEQCAARKTAATQEESLLKQLENFAADFGADKFENFRDRMDRLFGPRKNGTAAEGQATPADLQSDVQSNVQSNVEVQSQLKTESEAEAARESQSQLETDSASADVEQRHPVSQSQIRTGNPYPAAQVKPSLGSGPQAVNPKTTNDTDNVRVQSSASPSPISQSIARPAERSQYHIGDL